jgi:integrase
MVLPKREQPVKRRLTDRGLRALKPAKAGSHYDVWDTFVPGLGVRMSGTGRKTFVLIARFPGSKNPTRRKLATYGELTLEQARVKARDWLELLRKGIDPAGEEERVRIAEQRKRANTFAAVAEDFITDKLPSERKGREVERDIRREFISAWGGRPIADITPLDVRAVVKTVKDRGAPYQARNLLTTARRIFEWAIDQHCYGLEASPCDRLKPTAIVGKKTARTRVFSDPEWVAFWRAIGAMPYPYGPLLRMLALTGQRKSEVAEARWREFDISKRLWTIPPERMKTDAAHIVPLTDPVLNILKSLPRFHGSGDYLFSTTHGKKPVNGFSKAKAILDRTMVVHLGELPPFVIHDIRRSMRTGLSALPVADLVRELVIGHTKPGLHKVYDQHAYTDEKRRALQLWADRLRDIVEAAPGNVVALASE